jgi:signal transduction histidine kinase
MGLAIARGIVDAHGGKIWIEDAEGHAGAKFVIQLPVEDGDASASVRTGSDSDRIRNST